METNGKKGDVLILLAHPDMGKSKANKAMIEAIKEVPSVKVINLYTESLDVAFYTKALSDAKMVILQFPFYWASAPCQLKKWFDEVFIFMAGTDTIKDKIMTVATTTGSGYDAYRTGGNNQFTMDELLRPYQLCANHSGMVWKTPFVLYGTGLPDGEESICKGADCYPAYIQQFL